MLSFGPEIDKTFPLPERAHRPGENARPTEDLKAPVRASVDRQLSSENWISHDAYFYGFVLYRGGYYWEAHEIWEPVWMHCPPNSVERLLMQAIIQIANAALKKSQGNIKASAKLQAIASELLGEIIVRRRSAGVCSSFLGIELDDLKNQLKR